MKSNRNYVLGASLAVTMVGVICKILGLIREMSIASVFGASSHVDSYIMALSIPSLLIATIAGAIGTVVVPQFIRKNVVDGKQAALAMVETIWNVLFVCAIVIVLISEAIMPIIIKFIAPGFQGAVFNETVYLARIMMPAALFLCLLPIAQGILNSFQKYILTACIEVIQNIIIIISILFFARYFGIHGLAVGTLIGLTVQLFLLWPALRRNGFHPGIRIDWEIPELRQMVKLALPVSIGSGLIAINLFVNRMMASGLPVGTVAAINYANLIYFMPLVFVTPTVSTVFYTVLADLAARHDENRVINSVKKGLSLFAYIGFPMAGGMYLLAMPLVQIIYQRGAFDASAAQITASILAMYVLGFPAIGWREVTSRAFYAEGDTITPLYTGVLAIVVNIVLITILVKFLFAPGLALATAIASWVGAISIMWAWKKKHKGMGTENDSHPYGRPFWVETGKILMSTLIMVLAVGGVWDKFLKGLLFTAISNVRPGSVRFTLIQSEYLGLTVLLGIVIYVICTSLLKSENAAYIWAAGKQFAVKIQDKILEK